MLVCMPICQHTPAVHICIAVMCFLANARSCPPGLTLRLDVCHHAWPRLLLALFIVPTTIVTTATIALTTIASTATDLTTYIAPTTTVSTTTMLVEEQCQCRANSSSPVIGVGTPAMPEFQIVRPPSAIWFHWTS